jgi:ribosomal protein S17E
MDHMDLEELSDERYEDFKEIVPTLDEMESCDLRDIISAKITRVTNQLRHPARRNADGSPMDEESYHNWKARARDYRAHMLNKHELAKTQIRRIRRERSFEIEARAERMRMVTLDGPIGALDAFYRVVIAHLKPNELPVEEQVVIRAAKQILDHAKRQKVGA